METRYTLKDSRTVSIRPALEIDAEGCLDVLRSVAAEKIFIMTDEVNEGKKRRVLDSISRNGKGELFIVAAVDGKIVGTLDLVRFSSSPKADHVRDLGMSVINEYRSIGVGSAMMGYAIKWARSNNIEKITLSVFSTNKGAYSMYRKFGFEEEGVNRKAAKINNGYVDLINMGLFCSQ